MKVSTRETALTHALLVIAAVIAVYPLASIIVSSLTGDGGGVDWSNFQTAWPKDPRVQALVASTVVAVTVVLVTVVVACSAGFALGILRVPAGGAIMAVLLVGLVLPYEVTVLPLYELLEGWGLIDTYWALILPQIGLSVPLGVFWMRTFFRSVPGELLEAARIDGATTFQSLRLILFLFTWNEFLLALILVPQDQAVQTAPLALSFFAGTDRASDPNVTAAAAVLVALPVVLAYVLLQRRLITGLTSGAVK
jgi:raffinose/stachyose/melibiose transport system permease protein